MCTLTWRTDGPGLELRFNRDELHARSPAEPPRVVVGPARRWVAPLDPDGGGTWLGANDAGLVVALLNGYRRGDVEARPWRSRGSLVVDLLQLDDSDAVLEHLRAADLRDLRSFQIHAWSGGAALLASWDGASLRHERVERCEAPLSSSSRDPLGAARDRETLFLRLRAECDDEAEVHRRFHASHEPVRGPTSPCMHRDDARTQSHSLVRVDPTGVEFQYHAGPPCEGATPTIARLERALARWS